MTETKLPINTLGLQQLLQQAELIYDTATIDSAINGLAQRLTERLDDPDPLVLCVMQGGLMFTGKIMSLLPLAAKWLAKPKKKAGKPYRADTG
jgi:hypoxanthine phosphoribosyltransferase